MGLSIKEQVRQGQRELESEIRSTNREIRKVENKKKTLEKRCKDYGAAGNRAASKNIARQIIQSNVEISMLNNLTGTLNGAIVGLSKVKSTIALQNTMNKVTVLMKKTNKKISLKDLNKQVSRFVKEIDMNEVLLDTLNDNISEAFPSNEDEEDELVEKIFDELNIEFASGFKEVPNSVETLEVRSLEDRLKHLNGV